MKNKNVSAQPSPLREQLEKSFQSNVDTDFYYERLTSFPEGEWFYPTNAVHQDYSICYELHYCNLIEKRNEPTWVDGGFRGHRIFYRYRLDLKYNS